MSDSRGAGLFSSVSVSVLDASEAGKLERFEKRFAAPSDGGAPPVFYSELSNQAPDKASGPNKENVMPDPTALMTEGEGQVDVEMGKMNERSEEEGEPMREEEKGDPIDEEDAPMGAQEEEQDRETQCATQSVRNNSTGGSSSGFSETAEKGGKMSSGGRSERDSSPDGCRKRKSEHPPVRWNGMKKSKDSKGPSKEQQSQGGKEKEKERGDPSKGTIEGQTTPPMSAPHRQSDPPSVSTPPEVSLQNSHPPQRRSGGRDTPPEAAEPHAPPQREREGHREREREDAHPARNAHHGPAGGSTSSSSSASAAAPVHTGPCITDFFLPIKKVTTTTAFASSASGTNNASASASASGGGGTDKGQQGRRGGGSAGLLSAPAGGAVSGEKRSLTPTNASAVSGGGGGGAGAGGGRRTRGSDPGPGSANSNVTTSLTHAEGAGEGGSGDTGGDLERKGGDLLRRQKEQQIESEREKEKLRERVRELEEKAASDKLKLEGESDGLRKKLAEIGQERDTKAQEAEVARQALNLHRQQDDKAMHKLAAALAVSKVSLAREHRARTRERILRESQRVGTLGTHISASAFGGGTLEQTWEGGTESRDIAEMVARVDQEKVAAEKLKKELAKFRRSGAKAGSKADASGAAEKEKAAAAATNTAGGANGGVGTFEVPGPIVTADGHQLGSFVVGAGGVPGGASVSPTSGDERESPCEGASGGGDEMEVFLFEQRELLKAKELYIQKMERDIAEAQQRLQRDRILHMRELKTQESQENSQFKNFPSLHRGKYQLLNLLGKGGFSEVWEAWDNDNQRAVAVKVHQLKNEMSAGQKESYIRHALRESTIHKQLKHPRVVTFFERFAIDKESFATVLEKCEGSDLDSFMKINGALSEKEARLVTIQILSGLRHMNSKEQKVIHYDLKPGNVMYNRGEVKITDFGLSKVTNGPDQQTVELTSQGAGTYWYLPPECFEVPAPKISNKVDVWAVGVIFFEMLFQRKPFGHGVSQDSILQRRLIQSCGEVEFPPVPKISAECKAFIKRLLNPDRNERPNVHEAFNEPYLRGGAKGGRV